MEKEYLEALENMENMIDTFLVENKNKIEFYKVNNYDCELLEERRKDLESYKQALIKVQEQEKVLDDNLIFENGHITSGFSYKGKDVVAMPLNEYDRLMGQEEVLEILFEKQVDLGWLWYCIYECVDSLNEYNKKMPIEKFKLTAEEFDLLKKWPERR